MSRGTNVDGVIRVSSSEPGSSMSQLSCGAVLQRSSDLIRWWAQRAAASRDGEGGEREEVKVVEGRDLVNSRFNYRPVLIYEVSENLPTTACYHRTQLGSTVSRRPLIQGESSPARVVQCAVISLDNYFEVNTI